MSKPNILLQLDPDQHASAFDAVVALDAGVDRLLQYSAVRREDIRSLVHGAIFTRGMRNLHRTAIFIGGSDVTAGELLLQEVLGAFIGPMRVSVLLDANGANTTAAAAVLCAARHISLENTTATILAGTGPVGRRAARLLARAGAVVRVTSRRLERAESVCDTIRSQYSAAHVSAHAAPTPSDAAQVVQGSQLVIAAGAAGLVLLPHDAWVGNSTMQVAIDLNAVPPTGIEGVEPMDCAGARDGQLCYGAIGVGGLKMKIHKEAIRRLFASTEQVMDAEQIYDIGREIEA